MKRLFQLLVLLIGTNVYGQDVLMQGWYWDYPKYVDGYSLGDTLASRAQSLADAGIEYMWLPPLSRASFGPLSNGYDPQDLYDLGAYGQGPTGFGTLATVNSTIAALEAAGIKTVADVVYNHRDGGTPEDNPSVEGWIENYNCTKKDAGDNPYPSDRVRLVLPIGGSTGNDAGIYYIKVRSVSKHPDFYSIPYRFYAETGLVGWQNQTDINENEGSGNGGGDCGQGSIPITLGRNVNATIDNVGSCFGFCGIDEYALTVNAGDFDNSGDSIFIYLNNSAGYSDHYIAGIWNGSADVQSQVVYQTFTDFTNLPSGLGGMNYTNFRPNGNPTTLNGDEESMLFFYDYDQSVVSTKEVLRDWTIWLRQTVGIKGLRMDAVKHFPASFVSYLMDELHSAGQAPEFAVGESFDFDASVLKNWTDVVNNGMTPAAQADIDVKVFDFALRSELKNACDAFGYDVRNVFNSGIVRGVSGNKDHTVTFVNNHDFRADDEPVLNDPILPYAYILTNPEIGSPSIFYSDYYGVPNANAPTDTLENEMRVLLNIRKQHCAGATSVDYLNAIGSSFGINYNSGFDNTSMIYQINNGGINNDGVAVVVINYAGEPLLADVTLNTGADIANGDVMVDLTGKSMIGQSTVSNNQIKVQVPPRSYAIYVNNKKVSLCNREEIIKVDANADGLNNGSSWSDAFTSLSSAISVASGCTDVDTVYVKEGVYLANILEDRALPFLVDTALTIVGSFPNTPEPKLGDVDVNLYPTILSADIGADNDSTDNTYHVIKTMASGMDTVSLISLILTNGNADGASSTEQSGGGINNTGNLTLKNVNVIDNTASNSGSAIYNTGYMITENLNCSNNVGPSDIKIGTLGKIVVKNNNTVDD